MTKNLFLLGLGILGVAFVACDKKDDNKVQVEPTKEVAAPAADAHAAPATMPAPAAAPATMPVPAADAHAAPATMPAPAAAPAPAADAHAAPATMPAPAK